MVEIFSMSKSKPKNEKGGWFTFRIPEDLERRIKELAKEEDRSKSNVVVRLIRVALEKI